MRDKRLRIEVGDRVKSMDNYAPIPHEGVIKSIALGMTEVGVAPIIRVLVDKSDGKEVEPHLHETAPGLWEKMCEDGSNVPVDPSFLSPTVVCPACGEHHGTGPFTPEMMALFGKFSNCTETDERLCILQELGERFLDELDSTNADLPEWVHDMLEDVEQAWTAYHRMLLRVGRLVVRNLSEIGQSNEAISSHISKVIKIPLPGGKSGKFSN